MAKKTYTELQTRYQKLTKNTNTDNVTFGKEILNESISTICSIRNGAWSWLETVATTSSVASQQAYGIPNNIRKLTSLYYTVGTTTYLPTPIYSNAVWERIISANWGESNRPVYYYVQNDTVYLAPTPSDTSGTLNFRGRQRTRDLGFADYTTGTIITTVVGDETITGSGTTFEAGMVGRYLQIANTTAANGGDGEWYKIASVTSTTVLELEKPYVGTAITAGSATFIIGETSPIPEDYDMAPVYRAAAIYWEYQADEKKSERYWARYDGGVEAGLSSNYGGLLGQMFEADGTTVDGPYISPNLIQNVNPNNPQTDATGGSFT